MSKKSVDEAMAEKNHDGLYILKCKLEGNQKKSYILKQS